MVLNSKPLDDIRNTVDIAYVMKCGILYDDLASCADCRRADLQSDPQSWRLRIEDET